MYTVVKYGGLYNAFYKEFVCDTHNDLEAITTNKLAPGSKATVLDDGGRTIVYIYAGEGRWVIKPNASSGSGSGAGFDMTDEDVLNALISADCLRVRTTGGKILTVGNEILLW